MTDPLYRYPARQDLNLFRRMIGAPLPTTGGSTTPDAEKITGGAGSLRDKRDHARREDQCTDALAWLLDRDPTFALRFARKYVNHDERAFSELVAVERLAVETRIRRLPTLGRPTGTTNTRRLIPDLSLTAPERRFQLLIEVKVGARLGVGYKNEAGEALDQVAAYIESWKRLTELQPDREAEIRRVGTLTLDGDVPMTDDWRRPWRAMNLQWKDIAALLKEHEARPEMAGAVTDLRIFIEEELYAQVDEDSEFMTAANALVERVAEHLSDAVAQHPTHNKVTNTRPKREKGYRGRYVNFATPWSPERLAIVATAHPSPWAPQNSTVSALWLYFPDDPPHQTDGPPHPKTRQALERVGFTDLRLREMRFRQWFGIRLMDLDAESLADRLEDVSADACGRALGFLSEAGLTSG